MLEKGAAILGIGIVSAVGIGAKQTSASVRAGISRFSETSIYDKRFEPFVMAILPDDVLPPLEPELEKVIGLTARQARMLRLAAPAIQEALENVPNTEEIPLYLGVPESLPERPKPANNSLIEHLCTQSGIQLNIAKSKTFPRGRSAGLFALHEAIEYIASGTEQYILVGGVDTYVDLYLLGTFDMEGRILGPGTMDGFIPGEGAGFVLLTSNGKAKADNLSPLAFLTSVFTGYEEGHLYSDKTYMGDGLASVFEQLFREGGIKESIKEVYSSMNGENHWAKEWGVAFLRNQTFFDPEHGMHHPAECYGDPGAASGILMIILAAIAIKNGYSSGPNLATCSSDFGDRAVVSVTSNL